YRTESFLPLSCHPPASLARVERFIGSMAYSRWANGSTLAESPIRYETPARLYSASREYGFFASPAWYALATRWYCGSVSVWYLRIVSAAAGAQRAAI